MTKASFRNSDAEPLCSLPVCLKPTEMFDLAFIKYGEIANSSTRPTDTCLRRHHLSRPNRTAAIRGALESP